MTTDKDNPYLSVVIPAYNVALSISQVIDNISKILNLAKIQYELIVVNDGSEDKTLFMLEDAKKKNSNLNIISYEQNRGKGYAVRSGVLRSTGKFVMFIDGDLDISTDMIIDYVNNLDDCDLVIGSKVHPHSEVDTPASRRILSNVFGLVVRFCTDIKIRDTQVGLKIGRGDLMRKIFSIMNVNGYSFDVEMIVIASLMNARIKEMPIKMNIARKFKFLHSLKMLVDTLKISYRYKIKHQYQKKLRLQDPPQKPIA